ncbi:MAG: DUF4384 domain-containing protein [Alphaproteobacteria bacterium]
MNPRRIMAALAAVAILGAADARAGDLLVLDSSDPAHVPGTIVAGDGAMAVAAGAVVTLLAEDGSITRLDGPYQGAAPGAAASEGNLVSSLATMMGEGDVDTQAFGAVRGGDDGPAGIWTIDLSGSGSRCVDGAGPDGLWRGTVASGRFRDLASGTNVALAWSQPASTVPWPDGIAVVNGAEYAFVPDGGAGLAHIVIHKLPKVLPTAAHLLRWLGEQDCGAQARALLARIVEPPAALTLALDSVHGATPVLAVGEALGIRLATNRDAHVRCLYQQVDGVVVTLFPNRFTGGPRVAGFATHAIPSASDGFSLTMGGPPGTERVLCFAWSTDPSARLPAEVNDADITRPFGAPLETVLGWIDAAEPEARATLAIEVRE